MIKVGCASLKPNQRAGELSSDQTNSLLLANGKSAELRNEFDLAISSYQQLTQHDPKNTFAWHRMALLHDQSGHTDKSEECYQAAIELEPKNPVLWGDFAYSLYLKERWQESQQAFETSLTLEPANRVRVNYGMLLARTNRPDDALKQFRLAGLGEAQSRCNLAVAHLESGDLSGARSEQELAARVDFRRQATEHTARLNGLFERIDGLSQEVAKATDTPQSLPDSTTSIQTVSHRTNER